MVLTRELFINSIHHAKSFRELSAVFDLAEQDIDRGEVDLTAQDWEAIKLAAKSKISVLVSEQRERARVSA